jgi:hypothetical protein
MVGPANVVLVLEVVVVIDVVDVVLVPVQGQLSSTGWPTLFFRHRSASTALMLPLPSGSHAQAGQTTRPTADLRMNRQSDAVGAAPLLMG